MAEVLPNYCTFKPKRVNPSRVLSFKILWKVLSKAIVIILATMAVGAAEAAGESGKGGCCFRLAAQALIAVQVLVIALEVEATSCFTCFPAVMIADGETAIRLRFMP